MEKLFMSAGIVIAIVLLVVGILKLPFDGFKKKHPKCYKAIFTMISVVLALVLSILDQKFILCLPLLSVDFVILLCAVIAGVFGLYSGAYEGLALKELVKKLIDKIKEAKLLAKDQKAIKYLNNIDFEKIDIAIQILESRKNENNNQGEV